MLIDIIKKASWWSFSVPIYVKILGIGFLVTMLFGVATFYQIRVGVYRTHYKVYGETALSLATSLAARVEGKVRSGELTAIDREVALAMESFPDLRYVIIQEPGGSILSHGYTFPEEAPPDLISGKDLCSSCHAGIEPEELAVDLLEVPAKLELSAGRLCAYSRGDGLILEITVPLSSDDLGDIRLGVSDKTIARTIESIIVSLLWSLALCAAVGLSLALVLAFAIVKPIHNLVGVTQRVRVKDFEARARAYSEDEIGQLSESFDQMAYELEKYREQVKEKENARVSLIARIVQAQEDERKTIARELHDTLGQSLSKTLLTIESSCRDCKNERETCSTIKCDIRGLIDEVRELAWHTRPSILDDYGIDKTLRRYVEETARRADFTVDYQCVCPPGVTRLSSQAEVTLYRIRGDR